MVDRLSGKKVIGIKQTIKSINNGEGKIVYVADDAEDKLVGPVIALAKDKSLEVKHVNTMKELGRLCGIDVGAATALVLSDL